MTDFQERRDCNATALQPRTSGTPKDTIALTICIILILSIFSVGACFVAVPTVVVQSLFRCRDNGGELDLTLARLLGGVTLALSFSCASSFLPLLAAGDKHVIDIENNSVDYHRAFKIRIALSVLATTGLIIVLVGLVGNYDYRIDKSGEFKVTSVMYGGAFLLVLACVGMMATCWPGLVHDPLISDETDDEEEEWTCWRRSVTRIGSDDDNDPTIPLLSKEHHNSNDEEMALGSDQLIANVSNAESVTYTLSNDDSTQITTNITSAEGDTNLTQDNASLIDSLSITPAPSSRIRGTRRLIKLAGPQSFYIYLGCAVLLVRLPFSLSIPHFVSTTLGALARADYSAAKFNISILFLLGTIDAALDFWCVFLFGYAKERIVKGVRIDTFAAILRQDMAFFDAAKSGDLASRLNSDCGEMGADLTWFFRFSIEAVVRILGIVTYMLLRCPSLGLCAMSVAPIVALVNKRYGDWLRKNALAVQNALAEANSVAQESFSCVRTVIAFASEGFEWEKYREKINVHYRLNIRQLYLTGFYFMAISTFLINTCVQALLLYVGTILTMRGQLRSDVLLAFMLYQGQLQSEVLNLFQSYTSLIKSSGAGDKVFALLDRVTPAPGTGSPIVMATEEGATESFARQSSDVKIRDLAFYYPSRPTDIVLNGLDLDITKGSTMALVGPSGCGKSTIVGLIQRFYDPQRGTILIDGVDLKDIDVKLHRRHIGTVTQDPVLFSGTILSNLTYGRPTATREEVIQATTLANAHGFIQRFRPNKYETQVGERGVQLSGGQKQRIAIARAIILNPSLLLLDEATSALDSESEKVVQDALDSLLKQKRNMTTIIVAHRLQTVRDADCIAVINHGRVVEKGTHDELVQIQGGMYKRMVERASDKGILSEN